MKTNWQTKKEKELEVAIFFINRLNKRFNLDYNPILNNDETKGESDVDIYANSKSNKEQLKLQITTHDGQILKDMAGLHKEADKNGTGFATGPVRDLEPEKLISKAIKNKTYSDPSNLFLIVYTEFGALVNENWAKNNFPLLGQDNYKGIFWVRMPSNSKYSSHPHSGQIVAIKNPFGESGISL